MFELDWLKKWGTYSPGACALMDADGVGLTYSQFYQQACACAEVLQKHFSIRENDRVALISQNEVESVVLFYALQRLGAILVPVNFRLTARELAHIIADCDAKLVVHQNENAELVSQIKDLQTRDGVADCFQTSLLKGPSSLFEKVAESFSAPEHFYRGFPSDEKLPVMILYTSGTTGAPKGAIITHEMIFWNAVNTSLRLNLSQQDSAVIFLPLFHTGGWNVLMTPFFHRGGRVILTKKFDADQILKITSREKCTLLFGVPTTMDIMSRSPIFAQTDLSSLRYAIVGGEPMPIELIQTWDRKNIPIRQGYGLTEFGPNVFSLNEEDAIRKIGSIGFPNFYTQIKIVNKHGAEVMANQIGELLLKGFMCMAGYWKNEKATAETIQDGWLRTGDLVRQDEEGYVYVVGRKKDMYISGGENVYPAEVEKVIRSFDGVREVAVIGVEDEKWGEVGKAFVVAESAKNLTETEIQNYCLKNLAKFKIPKHIVFISSLPKGDSGKILKKELR